ncbi:MAG: TetR/AcrR family transcriptional regulator [Ignavibacteriae bacterium]|nr:TetR/AcrR family transcriptional regulator [Ignavibacteriota bacterium]
METHKTIIVSLNILNQTEKDRSKILDHARKKFHAEGFYKTSMDEIAKDLHISKKTIYKHFPSKEELLRAICNDTTCIIKSKIVEIIEGDEDVVVKFVRLLNMHSNMTMNISDKWVRDLTIHAPAIKREIDEMKNDQVNKIFTKLLDQGKREKLIENYPTPIIIASFDSSLKAVVNHDFLINNKFTILNAFQITYEMLLNGILTVRGKEKFKKTKVLLAKEIKL